jgi:hypothetical protein
VKETEKPSQIVAPQPDIITKELITIAVITGLITLPLLAIALVKTTKAFQKKLKKETILYKINI